MHPEDAEEGDDPAARFRTVYLGGAGVVAALHRLQARGFVELRRDYVSYLERSLEAGPDFPGDDAERSLWMGETGIRLVLQLQTGDELWLTRVRAFAAHAAARVELSRSVHGRGRHTLWTGDLGTALYLADCVEGRGELPLSLALQSRLTKSTTCSSAGS